MRLKNEEIDLLLMAIIERQIYNHETLEALENRNTLIAEELKRETIEEDEQLKALSSKLHRELIKRKEKQIQKELDNF